MKQQADIASTSWHQSLGNCHIGALILVITSAFALSACGGGGEETHTATLRANSTPGTSEEIAGAVEEDRQEIMVDYGNGAVPVSDASTLQSPMAASADPSDLVNGG